MNPLLFGGPYRPKGPQTPNLLRPVLNRNNHNKEGSSKFARFLITHPATPGTKVISMANVPYVVTATGALMRIKEVKDV